MNGQGLSALIVCTANLVSILAGKPVDSCEDDEGSSSCENNTFSPSALAYFIVATSVLVLNVCAFFLLRGLPISR